MICTDIYDTIWPIEEDATNTMGNSISFIIDMWPDTSIGFTLLSLTAHAINRDFERVNFV